MRIPIAKPSFGQEEIEAVNRCLQSGWVSQGPKVKEFEDAFAKYTGACFAVAVSNCTTALHLALKVLGVSSNDCVITVSHSFIATANAIQYCGATPLFIDIEEKTFNMCPKSLEQFLCKRCQKKDGNVFFHGKRVKAILVVHQMGLACNLPKILEIAKTFNLPIVEDAACASGSKIFHEKIGKPHGSIACFSFHPRKVLSTGEGGMLTTNDPVFDEKFRLLRQHGMTVPDSLRHHSKQVIIEEYIEVGYNYRMTDIQASIGLEQLKKLDRLIAKRRALDCEYRKYLGNIPWLKLPFEPCYATSNWQSYPVWVLDNAPLQRNELMQYLLDHGVATRPGIMNAHEEKAYQGRKDKLPISEKARRKVILFPMFDTLKIEEIETIAKLLKKLGC